MVNRSGKSGSGKGGNSGGANRTAKNGSLLGKKPRPKKAGESVYVRDDAPRMNAPRAAEKILPQINKRLGEFTIERWSHDGRGLTNLDGKTLFVQGALPGERVSARLVEEHPRFIDARVDQIIEISDDRTEPPCPHYQACGGCQLQHVKPQAQIELKQHALVQQLQHWGKVSPKRILPAVSVSAQGYRNRARLGVWYEQDGSVSLGFRQQQSKTIAAIQHCLVLAPELNTLIPPLQQWLEQLRSAKAVTHIELVRGGDESAVILRHTKNLTEHDLNSLAQFSQQHVCNIWLEPNGNRGLTDLAGNPCSPRLNYLLRDLSLNFHPQDFTQVNPHVNELMVTQALALLDLQPHERVLDLFCGIGNFTLPIARNCREVIGIEAVESMVVRGRENAESMGITNAKFIAANLADMTHTQLQRLAGGKEQGIAAILLDPPRDGAKEVVTTIKQWVDTRQLSPKRIVYVSCNPATLARDAAILAEAGYQLDAAGVLDMFPHTSHVESMALFLLK